MSLPDSAFVTRALQKLEFFTVDFFLSETAARAASASPSTGLLVYIYRMERR